MAKKRSSGMKGDGQYGTVALAAGAALAPIAVAVVFNKFAEKPATETPAQAAARVHRQQGQAGLAFAATALALGLGAAYTTGASRAMLTGAALGSGVLAGYQGAVYAVTPTPDEVAKAAANGNKTPAQLGTGNGQGTLDALLPDWLKDALGR